MSSSVQYYMKSLYLKTVPIYLKHFYRSVIHISGNLLPGTVGIWLAVHFAFNILYSDVKLCQWLLKGLAMIASVICVHRDNIAPQFQPGRVPASIPCGCGIIPTPTPPPPHIGAGLPENVQRKLAELPFSATVAVKLLYILYQLQRH
jgi:hypothetical protein